ncbi:hypothetical protein T01_8176 [Trichinella spiralis]|uniref:Uncharacterized protein n=1 Tax=Trichinella spiralis TaxID=6334 RepID=A0A0V1AXS6_TRISP|nr:hypothetical protein T01_8176 [Trichinella spiralis]
MVGVTGLGSLSCYCPCSNCSSENSADQKQIETRIADSTVKRLEASENVDLRKFCLNKHFKLHRMQINKFHKWVFLQANYTVCQFSPMHSRKLSNS